MTIDKYTDLKKNSLKDVFEEITKNKNRSREWQLPEFRFQPKTCFILLAYLQFNEEYNCKTRNLKYINDYHIKIEK